MSHVKIYHNPRCSKSRQTLDLIKRSGHEPEVIEYLKQPPSAETLDSLFKAMGMEPLEATRTKESLFKELGLNKSDDRSRSEWLKILAENPKLIERPIVVCGNKVCMGRPPENVLDILD